MSLQLSSFINRYKTTTEQSKMTKTASNVDQNEYNQYGALNTNALNNNDFETNIEMVGIHIMSAGGIVMLVFIIFMIIVAWRCCKKKNRKKIMHFICVKKCKYLEDPEDRSENTDMARHHHKQVQEVPLDVNRLVELSNQLALNNAVAQVQSQSRTPSTTNLSTVATVETPVNM